MEMKLKYYSRKVADPIEFPQEVVRIILPNEDEYTLKYDHVRKGLVISKVYSEDGNTAMAILPGVSNQVTIK